MDPLQEMKNKLDIDMTIDVTTHATVEAIIEAIKTQGLEKTLEDLRKACTVQYGKGRPELYEFMLQSISKTDKIWKAMGY